MKIRLVIKIIVQSNRNRTRICFTSWEEEFALSRLRQRIDRRKKEREILQPRRMPCNDVAHPGGRLKWRRSPPLPLLLFFCHFFSLLFSLLFPSSCFMLCLCQLFPFFTFFAHLFFYVFAIYFLVYFFFDSLIIIYYLISNIFFSVSSFFLSFSLTLTMKNAFICLQRNLSISKNLILMNISLYLKYELYINLLAFYFLNDRKFFRRHKINLKICLRIIFFLCSVYTISFGNIFYKN